MNDKKPTKESGSQLMSCLVLSRPRSSQQRPQQSRVASGKQTSTQKLNNPISCSLTTLKVSQFSSTGGEKLSNIKDVKGSKTAESLKFYTIQKNEQENIHPPQKRNEEYFTVGQENLCHSVQQEELITTNRVIELKQTRPQSQTTLEKRKPFDNSFLKSQSTSNVLKPMNRQQSPKISKSIMQSPTVKSGKVLKKTVNLGVEENKSRDNTCSKVIPQNSIIKPQEQSETNVKFDIVLNKYKNSSYFSQENQPTTLFQQQIEQQPEVLLLQQTASASVVSKYITRVSRGKTLMGQVFSKKKEVLTNVPRKRMNSPLHRPHEMSIFSSRDGMSPSKTLNQKKQISSADKSSRNKKKLVPVQYSSVSNPLFIKPFNEFGYYMSFLQYFHQHAVAFKNAVIPTKIAQLYNNNNKETISYFEGIYREHFLQSYHALLFCRDVEKSSYEDIKSKIVNLPPCKFKRTLIFDLDETLIHCNENNESPADVTLPILFPSGETIDAGINIRPFCREMLTTLSTQFEVIVFTASHECYASKVLDHLDPENKIIHHRFFRNSCVIVDDGLHIKDLRVLGNRDLKNMLIVDNAAYSYYFQMENGVPIAPFYDNQQDRELIYLTAFLQQATQQPDMLQYNMSYFKHEIFADEDSPEGVLAKMF